MSNRAVHLIVLLLVLAVYACGQSTAGGSPDGPQLLFPIMPKRVTYGNPELNMLATKVKNNRYRYPVGTKRRGIYKPAMQMSIRGLIKSFGGVDPLLSPSLAIPDFPPSFLRPSRRVAQGSSPPMRSLPSTVEYQGMGGFNAKFKPRGADFQIGFGNNASTIPDGPLVASKTKVVNNTAKPVKPVSSKVVSFIEQSMEVIDEDTLDIEALAKRGMALKNSGHENIDLRSELQSLIAAGSKLHLNNGVQQQQQQQKKMSSNRVAPMMVKKLGQRKSISQANAEEEAALMQQAEAAMLQVTQANAEAESAAVDAEHAQQALEAEQAEAQQAEQAEYELQVLEKATKNNAFANAEQYVGESFIQAEQAQRALEASKAQAEVTELAEAVAEESIKQHTELTEAAISKLRTKIRVAKEQAAAEAVKPWWAHARGRAANAKNAIKRSTAANMDVSFLQQQQQQANTHWSPPAPLQQDPTAFMHQRHMKKGYAFKSSFLESMKNEGAEVGAIKPPVVLSTPTGNSFANPGPVEGGVRLDSVANPYAFSTADILYPQLRSYKGASGIPQAPHNLKTAPAPAPSSSSVAQGPASITINIQGPATSVAPAAAPAAQAPTPLVQQPTVASLLGSPAALIGHPGFGPRINNDMAAPIPVVNGANPFSLAPNMPGPSSAMHMGLPTPGGPAGDNAAFGSLRV